MRRIRLPVRRRAGGENVDSLLDTMANVVGILVVLMAVIQLTVNDAMKRIQVWETEESHSLREARREAEDELARSAGIDLSRTLELSRLREHIESLRAQESVADTPSVSASVASQRLRVRRLEASLAEEEERLANLQILLKQTEARSEDEGVALRLPDPRPAPAGAKELVLMARHDRVFDPRFEQLTDEIFNVTKRAPRPWSRYFDAYDVGNEMLRWRVRADNPGHLTYQLEWRRPDVGETPRQLARPGSELRRVLQEHDPSSRFIQFYVWGDSFEAYLEARRVAEEAGYSVGWVAIPTDSPLNLYRSEQGPVTPVD